MKIQKLVKDVIIKEGWRDKRRLEACIELYIPQRAIERGYLEFIPTYLELGLTLNNLIKIYSKREVEESLGIEFTKQFFKLFDEKYKVFKGKDYYLAQGSYRRTTNHKKCMLSNDVWNYYNPNNKIISGDRNVIHHIDENDKNNEIENLCKIKKYIHTDLHVVIKYLVNSNTSKTLKLKIIDMIVKSLQRKLKN